MGFSPEDVPTPEDLQLRAGILSRGRHKDITEDWTAEEIAAATALVEKQREERRRAQAAIERRARIDAHHRSVLEGDSWTTADNRVIGVEEMTPQHALNTLRMLEEGRHPTGRWAINQAEFTEGHAAYGYTCTFVRFGRWPLTDALWKRANESPTLLDKLDDWRSLRRWKKGKR